jgi:urea transport system substrate-binding protein
LEGGFSYVASDLDAEAERSAVTDSVEIALLIPLSGSAGMFGPSCECCAELAAEEINAAGGLLGRQVHLVAIDGARSAAEIGHELGAMLQHGTIDAVVGWHISAVRQAIAPIVAPRVPYVYTALYEGGERTPGVFLTGEVPDQQLGPAIRWMANSCGSNRWSIVGNDYVWPRSSAAQAYNYVHECGGTVQSETYVPLGADDFSAVLDRLEQARPDTTLTLLVGADAVEFNRAFCERGLDGQSLRLSPLMDENMLAATGPEASRGICSSAGFFDSLVTVANLDFRMTYQTRFGPSAPSLNAHGESCYEGVMLLSALVKAAGSLDVRAVSAASEGVRYNAARGELVVRNRHVQQPIYLATADGTELSIVTQL